MGGGVDAAGEFVVGHRFDELRPPRARAPRPPRSPAPRAREREHRGRGRRSAAGHRASAPPRAPAPPLRASQSKSARNRPSNASTIISVDGLRRGGIRDPVQRGHDPGAGLLVAAEHVLHAGARDRQPDAHPDRFVRHEPDALEQVGAALLEPARGAERACARASRSPTRCSGGRVSGSRRSAAPNQRAALAGARSARRLPASRRTASAAGVAVPCGVLDMVRPRRAGRAALGERVARSARARRAASRRAPPRRRPGARAGGGSESGAGRPWRGRVSSASSSSSAATAASSLDVRRGGGQLGLERVARHGGALQQRPRRLRQQPELLRERRGHGRRHADRLQRRAARASARPAPRGAGELLQVERVAAALLVEASARARVDVLAEQLGGLVALEPAQLDRRERRRPGRARSSARGQPVGELPRPRAHARAAPRRRAAGAAARRAARPTPGPPSARRRAASTSGLRRRHPLEQLAHRAVGAVALVLERRRGRRRRRPTATGSTRASSTRTSSSSESSRADRAPRRTRRGHRRRARTAGRAPAPTRCRDSTMQPRASARAASSASRRVLPMPGSPVSTSAPGSPRSQSVDGAARAARAPRRARRGARGPWPACSPSRRA